MERYRKSFYKIDVGYELEKQLINQMNLEIVVGEVQITIETNESISYKLKVGGAIKPNQSELSLEADFLTVSGIEILAIKDDDEKVIFILNQLSIKRKVKIYDKIGTKYKNVSTIYSGLIENFVFRTKMKIKSMSTFICSWLHDIIESLKQTAAEVVPIIATFGSTKSPESDSFRLIDITEELSVEIESFSVYISDFSEFLSDMQNEELNKAQTLDLRKKKSIVYKKKGLEKEIIRNNNFDCRSGTIDFKLIKYKLSKLISQIRKFGVVFSFRN